MSRHNMAPAADMYHRCFAAVVLILPCQTVCDRTQAEPEAAQHSLQHCWHIRSRLSSQSLISSVTHKLHGIFPAGRDRCLRIDWTVEPTSAMANQSSIELAGCIARKDANEMLVQDGPEAIRQCIDRAKPLPLEGPYRCVA